MRSTRSLPSMPNKPAWRKRRAASSFLFDLAPDVACHAALLAKSPVVSYTTFSPLFRHSPCGVVGTVCFLWRFPFPLILQRAPPEDSGGILPCGVRTFLPGAIRKRKLSGATEHLGPSISKELDAVYAIRAASTISCCRNCTGSLPGPSWPRASGEEGASCDSLRRQRSRRWPPSRHAPGRSRRCA